MASCAVCLECFNSESLVSTSICGHIMHHACWSKWLKSRQTCPICQASVSKRLLLRIYLTSSEEYNYETLRDRNRLLSSQLVEANGKIQVLSLQLVEANAKIQVLSSQLLEANSNTQATSSQLLESKLETNLLSAQLRKVTEQRRMLSTDIDSLKKELGEAHAENRQQKETIKKLQREAAQVPRVQKRFKSAASSFSHNRSLSTSGGATAAENVTSAAVLLTRAPKKPLHVVSCGSKKAAASANKIAAADTEEVAAARTAGLAAARMADGVVTRAAARRREAEAKARGNI